MILVRHGSLSNAVKSRRSNTRRGVAVLLVFLVLAVTIGLSYAAIRSQSTSAVITRNAQRNLEARHVALTGATLALKWMHSNSWSGIDVPWSGTLGSGRTFRCTFVAGDPRLNPSHPDWNDFPYRVTLTVVGRVADPDHPQCAAEHTIRLIVRLIPRALRSPPSQWAELNSATVYQNAPGNFRIYPGARIEGPVRTQAVLQYRDEIEWSPTEYNGYFLGSNQRRLAGLGDQRLFTGPIRLVNSWQSWDTLTVLNTQMGVATSNSAAQAIVYWWSPVYDVRYRIYPGGPEYSATVVGDRLQQISLGADPRTNPVGLYYRAGPVDLRNDVNVRGTLMVDRLSGADVNFRGERIAFRAVDLPSLDGENRPVQLPTLIVGNRIIVREDSQSTIRGLVVCYDLFDVSEDQQGDVRFLLEGRLIAAQVRIRHRSDWKRPSMNSTWWANRWAEYGAQKDLPGGSKFFPDFLNRFYQISSEPQIIIRPIDDNARYHWHVSPNSIYVPATGDPGLRWQIIDWSERL